MVVESFIWGVLFGQIFVIPCALTENLDTFVFPLLLSWIIQRCLYYFVLPICTKYTEDISVFHWLRSATCLVCVLPLFGGPIICSCSAKFWKIVLKRRKPSGPTLSSDFLYCNESRMMRWYGPPPFESSRNVQLKTELIITGPSTVSFSIAGTLKSHASILFWFTQSHALCIPISSQTTILPEEVFLWCLDL